MVVYFNAFCLDVQWNFDLYGMAGLSILFYNKRIHGRNHGKSILSPDDGMDPANYEHSCVNNILVALVIYYIAEYCIKGWCSPPLRIAYCSLIVLTVTPLSQMIPVNLGLVFCIVHVLSLVTIRIIDVRLEYDRHNV